MIYQRCNHSTVGKLAKNTSTKDSNYEYNFIDTINIICFINKNVPDSGDVPDSRKENRINDRGLKHNLKVKQEFVVMDTDSNFFIEIPGRVPLLSCIAESLTVSENEVSFVKGYEKSILGKMNLDKYLDKEQSKDLFK